MTIARDARRIASARQSQYHVRYDEELILASDIKDSISPVVRRSPSLVDKKVNRPNVAAHNSVQW